MYVWVHFVEGSIKGHNMCMSKSIDSWVSFVPTWSVRNTQHGGSTELFHQEERGIDKVMESWKRIHLLTNWSGFHIGELRPSHVEWMQFQWELQTALTTLKDCCEESAKLFVNMMIGWGPDHSIYQAGWQPAEKFQVWQSWICPQGMKWNCHLVAVRGGTPQLHWGVHLPHSILVAWTNTPFWCQTGLKKKPAPVVFHCDRIQPDCLRVWESLVMTKFCKKQKAQVVVYVEDTGQKK